ncbi:MAG: 3-dehydroquinate synthase [Methanomassiliicoccaceae archaeon]|jgi:3-dehydroquinate synthase|nr:3-dehydroquinate synthase [Methanomassiliicoccaceae archaeon]
MSPDFLIEGRTFWIPKGFSSLDGFTVRSVPRSYDVTIKNDPDPAPDIQTLLDENSGNLLLIDERVYDLHFKCLNVEERRILKAPATEEFKTLNGFEEVIAFLEKNQFTKGEKLIVVGGGIIQDVGAFVGACYKRGINWVFFPTTLLAMCDSCIGGKAGINHNRGKNQLALFSAPREVIVNIGFLRTLSDHDIKSGMGEILKLLVTGGEETLGIYRKEVAHGKVRNFESYKPLILSALSVKRAVIEEDEFELFYRKSLNYGHTIGHAIEVLSEYRIPHGQAVIMGMVIVNKLAMNRGILNNADYKETQRLSKELLGDSILKGISLEGLSGLLKKDKKTEGNTINFVFISKLGDTMFIKTELNQELIREIDETIQQEF